MRVWTGDQFFNPAAFALPTTGADVFDNPAVAKRNSLVGPGTWGVNLGVRKFFRFSETTKLEVGSDFNNVFNHPLLSPLDTQFGNLGDFDIGLNSSGQIVIRPIQIIFRETPTLDATTTVSRRRGLIIVDRSVRNCGSRSKWVLPQMDAGYTDIRVHLWLIFRT
jgi:hypothetical protein